MNPSFALALLIGAFLLLAGLQPTAAQEQAGGTQRPPLSPLFEELENRTSEDAARRVAVAGEDARSVEVWDRERAFAGMERLRAEIVMLGGLHGAQRELLQWNRERIKTGRAPAVLPSRLCREIPLGAWCPLLPATFGVASRAAAGSTAMSAAVSAAPAAENTSPAESGNPLTKDELQ